MAFATADEMHQGREEADDHGQHGEKDDQLDPHEFSRFVMKGRAL
jgi:hypothetical protein